MNSEAYLREIAFLSFDLQALNSILAGPLFQRRDGRIFGQVFPILLLVVKTRSIKIDWEIKFLSQHTDQRG